MKYAFFARFLESTGLYLTSVVFHIRFLGLYAGGVGIYAPGNLKRSCLKLRRDKSISKLILTVSGAYNGVGKEIESVKVKEWR
ncbi:MAG: hypothetical protein ACO2Y1_09145 [Flavobacteriaceae bacterium]